MTKEEIIHEINTKKDWYPKSYAGFLFGIYMQGEGLSRGSKEIPLAISYGMVYQNHNRQDHWDWFWNIGKMIQKRNEILEKAVSEKAFADTYFKAWEKTYENYLAAFEEAKELDLNSLYEILSLKFRKLYETLIAQAAYGYVVDTFLTAEDSDWLVEEIKNELREKATPEVIATLTAPVFHSFIGEFNERIRKLALSIRDKRDSENIQKEALKITKEFFWIKTNYRDYGRITQEQVLHEASQLLDKSSSLSESADHSEKNRTEKDRILESFNASARLRRILHISELFTHIQDKRKECVLRNNSLFFEFLETIAKRESVDKKLFFYSTSQEFFSFLKGIPLPTHLIEKRIHEGVMVLFSNDTSYLMYKEEIDSSLKSEHLFPNLQNVTELRGSIAFKGKVKGTVRVLRNTTEINTFGEGQILVANQTTPEFVPAMKKAAAIVTDQGGITCHAAIVARELKKPCIIGTKNATQVLKDGDVVEVDAEKGIVRIL